MADDTLHAAAGGALLSWERQEPPPGFGLDALSMALKPEKVMAEQRGYCAVGLHQAKTPENIGNVLRAAGCYGAAMVGVSGRRYRPHATDTLKAWRHMPLIEVDDLKTIVPYDCTPVAVELLPRAKPLQNYHHPERAFYIFGPEDGSLGEEVIEWCRDVVSVPTVFCMNLAACVNVLLYDRLAKRAVAAGGNS